MGTWDRTLAAGEGDGWAVEVAGDGPPRRVALNGSTGIIGRSPGCEVRLEHPLVSRGHARLELLTDGRTHVVDLGSHNGTLVNGKRISEATLDRGDRVTIGPFTLTADPVAPRVGLTDDSAVVKTMDELGRPKLAVAQLHLLEEFGRKVLQTPGSTDRLVALCRFMLQPQVGGSWAMALAVPAGGGDPTPMCPPQHGPGVTPVVSRSLVAAAAARREPVLATNQPASGPADIQLSIAPEVSTLAAFAVPLSTESTGPVELLCAGFPPRYATGEWLALCSLAARQHRQSEMVWANIGVAKKLAALEADLEKARKVQDRLVPKRCELPGLDVAVRFRPCHGVGGDYVDALPLPDGRSLLVIADVAGKGLPAAMVAMGLHTIVHATARRWTGLVELASALDAHLVESLSPDSFVTLLAMTIDPATGAVEAVNAAHPPAAVFGSAGHCRSIGVDGDMMLGPYPQTLNHMTDRLADGESALLFTDGCFELIDAAGNMLGPDDLCRTAAGPVAQAPTAAAAADAVVKLLDDWQGVGEPHDDRTLLLVRRRNAVMRP